MGIILINVKNYEVHNVLIHIKHTDKALNADKVSRLLISMLSERGSASRLSFFSLNFCVA